MPSCLIDDQNGVRAGRYLGRDLIEMPLHGLGVAAWQDEGRADAPGGTDGAEDPGRFGALVLGRPGPGSPFRPAPRELGFLSNSGFALPSIRPAGPLALNRRTQSRTTCSPTAPIRAAAVRRPPSYISANARRRRLCPASFDALAKPRKPGPSKSSRNATALPMANLHIWSPH
jgi:hypothetical protein